MSVRFRMQEAEVLGDDNRYYCSLSFQDRVDDPETLWQYFIRNGGAANFAFRWTQAMSSDNRYYCGRFYDRQITDEEILWEYYMKYAVNFEAAERSQVENEARL